MQRISLVIATALFLGGTLLWAAEDKSKITDPKPISLKFIASDSSDGQSGIHTFASAEELEKKFPKHTERFDRAVDFKNEDLILVQWGSSGPPFGKLAYKTDKTSITFYVEEPAAEIRGQAYKLGADWFTIVKGAKVVFAKK